jgi:hypothetical protein
MPNLGDYIGQLLSEITIARMHADLEAVRVAELYAGHPLLRNMPVPHFRLPDVQIDVPVVIKQMDEPPPEETPRGAPSLAELRTAFDKVLSKWLVKERIRIKPEHEKKYKLMLDEKVATITQPVEVAIDVKRIADELSGTIFHALAEAGGPLETRKPLQLKMLEEKLEAAVRIEFFKLRKPPPRLQALVTTMEIREAGPSESITRLHLKITEEAVEWTTIESDSRKENRLVPE